MGHVDFGRHFDFFIHSFHMPMFFLISGMFFQISKFSVRKKIKTLLFPYLFFGIFHYIIYSIFISRAFKLKPLLSIFFINTDGLPIAGALWFLTAIFGAELIYYVISIKIQKSFYKNICIFLIAILGCIINNLSPYRLPWALDVSFVGLGLIHIGYLLKNKYYKIIELFLSMNFFQLLIISIITTVLIFYNGYINMRLGQYSIIPLFWINATLATLVGLGLSKYIDKYCLKSIKRYLIFCGKNSILFLCLNQLIILLTKTVFIIIGIDYTLKVKPFITILSLLFIYIITYFIINTKLKRIIGYS